jgi:hypothetical protein
MLSSFLTRDAVSFYAFLAAIYILLNMKYGKNKVKYEGVLFLFFVIIIGSIRREGLATFLILVSIYSYYKHSLTKNRIKYFGICILTFIICNVLGGKVAPNRDQASRNQKIYITLSHYIGSIIKDDYISEDKARDKRIINEYYDYEIMKKRHVHYDVLPLHYGARKWRGKERLDVLIKFTIKLIVDNPKIFLKSRYRMIQELILPSAYLSHYSDDYGWYLKQKRWKFSNELLVHNIWMPFKIRTNMYIEKIRDFLLSKNHIILYSSLPSLVILFLTLLFCRKLNFLALLSVPYIFKSFVMFILMQKAQFQYFADIYILGLMLIPFIIIELRQTEKSVIG